MKRILFFVHYNKYNKIAAHVLQTLQSIKHLYDRVVFVSNSPVSHEYKNKLDGLQDKIILRENKGFDFGAWKDALLSENAQELFSYDNITLMNDTGFGPLFPIDGLYKAAEESGVDFWGLTLQQEGLVDIPLLNLREKYPAHIQSYFMSFNKNVVSSDAFVNFWKNVQYETRVENVILKYETQLTHILADAGFKYVAMFNSVSMYETGITTLVKLGVPFIKVKEFKSCGNVRAVKKYTKYPVSLICDYFSQAYPVFAAFFFRDKPYLLFAFKRISKFAYHKYVNRKGKLKIKILKIPVYSKNIKQ
ncbi:rhamnan synthesis F family protein [Endomicrobium proavitum]|uniref:Uncharacterized protein n=1 Tax=Endomicrobium proavitum TaxID=1408281 RepID=A0A0G3WJZ0_9BACT|nr:rhamnan synthesis F family protein [Endomicrobium proavitum]AKL98623.1 hypothetical protein Epro_1244 [Endomicrobium proavitum]